MDAHGDEATVYGGATELVVAMKLGLIDVPVLIDLKGIPDLADIMVDDDRVRIGAMATHRQIESDPEVAAMVPVLCQVERSVANPRIRAAGSIGGNLAFGEPHSDPATYLAAADAQLVCWSTKDGARSVPAASFLTGPFETALRPDELIVEIVVPRPGPATAHAYHRFVMTERPAAGVAVSLSLRKGAVHEARIIVGAACPTPTTATRAAQMALGCDATLPDDALDEIGRTAGEEVVIETGADEEYLRHIVGVLTTRSLREAMADASTREQQGGPASPRTRPPRRRWGRR